MFNYINDDIITALPTLQFFFMQNEQNKTLQLNLPVFIHCFSVPYEMDNNTYLQIYNRFTNSEKYFKLDEFVPIPSDQQAAMGELMKKIKQILQNFMKMHVNVFSDGNWIQLLTGSAQNYRQSQDH